ncbi:hypothetical protein NM688_g4550 [Phlebia brevispora]|uniref:Uncharacterized protein n=1 Tax=Phlebia brevispora TaxID=194682 RepID=A0ACC1T2B5_9APHY|nr:hypothetical protein NM688_g4550 [Phlebia brevispora]
MNGSGPGETGVLAWCNSLRLNIAKDPGREFLEAQIQKQGFDFLESYREGVFSRQREDPVYELLKTPSRKKDAGKKTRSAAAVAAKVKAANAALQEAREISVSKENVFPINDFHKALLEAKASGSQGNHHAETSSSQDTKKQHTKIVTIIDSPEAERMEIDDLRPPQSVPPLPDTTSLRHNIPADCEPRAHTAEVPSATAYTLQHDSSVPLPLGDALAHPTYEQSSSEPLELIADEDKGPAPESQSETGMVTVSGPEQLTAHGLVPKELSMIVEGDEPEEPSNSGFPGISPDDAGQDITVPLRDEPSSNTLKRKPSMTQFSGLPAPSPLRKSMRMSREPSVGQGLSTAFSLAHTPGAGLGSKRTSWLTKAKQAKASEVGGSGKRAVTPGGGFFGGHGIPSSASTEDMTEEYTGKHSGGLGLGFVFPQREVAETEDTTKWEPIKPTESTGSSLPKGKQKAASLDGDRVQAQAQRSEHPTSLPLPPPHSDMQPTPFHSENDPTVHTTSADSEDDVLDRLKKTVEDLGARTGKGVAKSLGGTAAAALAEMAEARAAAAVRVAQRNQQEGGVDVDTDAEAASIAPVNVVVETLTEDKAEEHASMSHPRLSLSELTIAPLTETQKPDNESDSGLKATDKMRTSHIGDDSTSTTPPNSPPVILTHAPPLPKPVFTKPSPVFTIPAQPAAKQASSKDLSSKLPTTNPFTLPPKTAKIPPAVPPLVTPFSFGPSTLSAQSSKASTLSDSIFDKEDSVPAWMAGTQDTEFSVPITRHSQELNEDDSWHMDEKFQSNQMWTPFGFTSSDKDDASTWSTFPGGSTSQRGEDTGSVMPTESLPVPQEKAGPIGLFGPEVDKADSEDVPERSVVNLNSDHDKPDENTEMDMDIDDTGESPDLDDLITSGKPTVTLVKVNRSLRTSGSLLNFASAVEAGNDAQSQPTIYGFLVIIIFTDAFGHSGTS